MSDDNDKGPITDPTDWRFGKWAHTVETIYQHPIKWRPGKSADAKIERLGTHVLWLPFPPQGSTP